VPPIFQIAPDLYSGKGKWNHWSVRMGLRPEPVVPLAERLQEAPAEWSVSCSRNCIGITSVARSPSDPNLRPERHRSFSAGMGSGFIVSTGSVVIW